MIRAVAWLWCVLASLQLTGCATVADAEDAKGSGVVRVYPVTTTSVWTSLRSAVGTAGLSVVKEDQRDGLILAQRGVHLRGFGENVAIFVSAVPGQKATRVEVVSRRSLDRYGEAVNWGETLLPELDRLLGQQGKTEPTTVIPEVSPRENVAVEPEVPEVRSSSVAVDTATVPDDTNVRRTAARDDSAGFSLPDRFSSFFSFGHAGTGPDEVPAEEPDVNPGVKIFDAPVNDAVSPDAVDGEDDQGTLWSPSGLEM